MRKHELNQRVAEYRRKVELASSWTDDTDALECIELFPKWVVDKAVIVGERLQYNEELYKCVQAHTTQADWTPDKTPALWVKISLEEYPQWIQPTGSADAYNIGDKVTFEDKHYESLINGNVWSPTAYAQGWQIVE